jgi:nucleoside-diphosphate-sugar epimerase
MVTGQDEKTVLVTGGTGFIGRFLVSALLEQNARVRVLVRAGSQIPTAWAGKVDLGYGDLEVPESLLSACQGIGQLFHAAGFAHAWAANSPQTVALHWRVNALGTQALVEAAAAAGVERFVFLSSVKAMGEGGKRCIDEDWTLLPQTPYGMAKRAAERWVLETGQRYGMHVVNLRLAMVYGPGSQGNLERMITGIRQGWFPSLPEIGNRRSMVHVRDVVQAALRAVADSVANQKTYIVTDGQVYSTREIYDLICQALGIKRRRWTVPCTLLQLIAWLGDIAGWIRGRPIGFDSEALDKLLGWACYRSDRIQQELGYRPSRTLKDSLAEIIQGEIHAG